MDYKEAMTLAESGAPMTADAIQAIRDHNQSKNDLLKTSEERFKAQDASIAKLTEAVTGIAKVTGEQAKPFDVNDPTSMADIQSQLTGLTTGFKEMSEKTAKSEAEQAEAEKVLANTKKNNAILEALGSVQGVGVLESLKPDLQARYAQEFNTDETGKLVNKDGKGLSDVLDSRFKDDRSILKNAATGGNNMDAPTGDQSTGNAVHDAVTAAHNKAMAE